MCTTRVLTSNCRALQSVNGRRVRRDRDIANARGYLDIMDEMITIRSILCPVDFSEESRHALRWAAAVARRTTARVTVLNAIDPLLAQAATLRLGLDLASGETDPAIREFLAATWSDETSEPLNANVDVRIGDPADVILDTAAIERTDLIVMGTHGLGGVRKWLLGSTTEKVLRRTHASVLAVPPGAGESVTARFEAASGLGPVLAATDFSDTSTRAVRWAAKVAQEIASPLLLVHVVEAIAVASQWRPYVAEAEEPRLADARGKMQALVKHFAESVKCDSLVENGRAAESIASIADERRATVIVMGLASSHGPMGSRPGSIAYRVLCLASVPVLVVPPHAIAQ
jgi:universal stress protein A